MSEETKAKLSQIRKGRKFSPEHSRNKSLAQLGGRNPGARVVKIGDKTFTTLSEAAKTTNLKVSTMHYRINSKGYPEYRYA